MVLQVSHIPLRYTYDLVRTLDCTPLYRDAVIETITISLHSDILFCIHKSLTSHGSAAVTRCSRQHNERYAQYRDLKSVVIDGKLVGHVYYECCLLCSSRQTWQTPRRICTGTLFSRRDKEAPQLILIHSGFSLETSIPACGVCSHQNAADPPAGPALWYNEAQIRC